MYLLWIIKMSIWNMPRLSNIHTKLYYNFHTLLIWICKHDFWKMQYLWFWILIIFFLHSNCIALLHSMIMICKWAFSLLTVNTITQKKKLLTIFFLAISNIPRKFYRRQIFKKRKNLLRFFRYIWVTYIRHIRKRCLSTK